MIGRYQNVWLEPTYYLYPYGNKAILNPAWNIQLPSIEQVFIIVFLKNFLSIQFQIPGFIIVFTVFVVEYRRIYVLPVQHIDRKCIGKARPPLWNGMQIMEFLYIYDHAQTTEKNLTSNSNFSIFLNMSLQICNFGSPNIFW